MDLTTIFYHVDEYCKQYQKHAQTNFLPVHGEIKRQRKSKMTLSELISIFIYHATCSQDLKTFKSFYKYTKSELQSAFPGLVSYERLTELKQISLLPLIIFLRLILGECTGILYGDSAKIESCNIKREYSHKTLKSISGKGKTGAGWFYGTKIHVVLNHKGEIVSFMFTKGNVADNNNELIRTLLANCFGKFFCDKGYILNPDLWQELFRNGLKVIHGLRSNMQPQMISLEESILKRFRTCIAEGFFSIVGYRMSLRHTRHRSVYGFFCNALSMLIGYQLRPTKPSIKFSSPKDYEEDFIVNQNFITENAIPVAV